MNNIGPLGPRNKSSHFIINKSIKFFLYDNRPIGVLKGLKIRFRHRRFGSGVKIKALDGFENANTRASDHRVGGGSWGRDGMGDGG